MNSKERMRKDVMDAMRKIVNHWYLNKPAARIYCSKDLHSSFLL